MSNQPARLRRATDDRGRGARAAARVVRGEGGTRRCIVIDTCSFGDSSPKMCSRHGPYSFCVCPRSFNQALLLSTRWMFGRVNRMVVIGRFGCVFWCEGGWWRTPIRAGQAQRARGQAQRSPMRRVAALMMARLHLGSCCVVCCGAAARARDRALFAAAVDAKHKRQLTDSCALLAVAAEAGASGQ